MDALEAVVRDIESVERHLGRRTFLALLAASAAVAPSLARGEGTAKGALGRDDREFLRRAAALLIPAVALESTGIDVLSNVEHLMGRGGADHRAKIVRLVSLARRVSFLYGGHEIVLRARGSRFVLVRKLGKVLSSLCLVAFWGDERALRLIAVPETAR